jgi:DNA-binding PadR family transcriptional regulator
MPDLTPFSYAVLALVGRRGAGPNDLARMLREGQLVWASARSQAFSEPKRLERLGYLTSTREPGRTTARTHYTLTEQGERALAAWVAEPAHLSRVQAEPILKLLAADLTDDATVLESLRALRSQLDEAAATLAAVEARAGEFGDRARYIRLNHAFARAILRAHEELLEAAERELS